MRKQGMLLALALAAGCQQPGGPTGAPSAARLAGAGEWNFDTEAAVPAGWEVAATGPTGPLAGWEVCDAPDAPSPPRVLSLSTVNDTSRDVFNLCWTRHHQLQDLTISAQVRGRSGNIDQGGGVIWRARDPDNYYIARFNPLESNYRLYCVEDGVRRMIVGASGIEIPVGQWFALRIEHRGDHIRGWLNGQLLLDARDPTWLGPGGIGVWTKADAATDFDRVRAVPLQP